jgi:hypothetical protein
MAIFSAEKGAKGQNRTHSLAELLYEIVATKNVLIDLLVCIRHCCVLCYCGTRSSVSSTEIEMNAKNKFSTTPLSSSPPPCPQ